MFTIYFIINFKSAISIRIVRIYSILVYGMENVHQYSFIFHWFRFVQEGYVQSKFVEKSDGKGQQRHWQDKECDGCQTGGRNIPKDLAAGNIRIMMEISVVNLTLNDVFDRFWPPLPKISCCSIWVCRWPFRQSSFPLWWDWTTKTIQMKWFNWRLCKHHGWVSIYKR